MPGRPVLTLRMWRFSREGSIRALIRNELLTLNRRFHRFGRELGHVGHKSDLCRDHQLRGGVQHPGVNIGPKPHRRAWSVGQKARSSNVGEIDHGSAPSLRASSTSRAGDAYLHPLSGGLELAVR